MTILRPYQRQALDAFWGRLAGSTDTRLAIEMATGLGKTVTGATAAAEWLDRYPDSRVLVLVHTEEITAQWKAKLEFAARGRHSVGIVKAGVDEPTADIVVASVQTLAKSNRRDAIRDVGFLIVDECHHAVAPTYRTIFAHYTVLHDVPILGLTATLSRSDGQSLGHVWQDLVFSRGISWAQRKGYLLDVVPWTIKVPDIIATASDAVLDAMLADSIAPEVVVDTWIEKCNSSNVPLGMEWPSTVLFAPLVKSAQAFADAFNLTGVKAEVIHGALGKAERQAILDRYEAGITTVLCNAMVLTEGWDSPRTMCIIWARPTKSVPLFIQGVGRGFRPWLDADAPPRESQRCILLAVTDTTGAKLATVADLSDRPLAEPENGKSLLAMEDEYDLGRDLEAEDRAYRGPVHVEQWDLMVQASSKAWKYTRAGVPFLPIAKRGEGYVLIVKTTVYVYGRHPVRGIYGALRIATAPDLSLAMALAEDEAQERGGDIGALLADKNRAWRKEVPSVDAIRAATRLGVSQGEIRKILNSRTSGKAGKLSDAIDRMQASRVLDPIVAKIRERARV